MNNQHISTTWSGYCPECLLEGNVVRMRLNKDDFYESVETGLQVCMIPGVQAVILKWRGTGDFREAITYASESDAGELLSPQNTDHAPFNSPTETFEDGDALKKYLEETVEARKDEMPNG